MICPKCGVDAMTEGGACTYCTGGHLDRVKAEEKSELATVGGTGTDGGVYATSFLNGSVAKVEEVIRGISEAPYLEALRAAEVDGKNRKGVLAAIDARTGELAAVGGTGTDD